MNTIRNPVLRGLVKSSLSCAKTHSCCRNLSHGNGSSRLSWLGARKETRSSLVNFVGDQFLRPARLAQKLAGAGMKLQ